MMVDLSCGKLAKGCDFWVFSRKDGKPKNAIPMFYHDALRYRHRQNSEKIRVISKRNPTQELPIFYSDVLPLS